MLTNTIRKDVAHLLNKQDIDIQIYTDIETTSPSVYCFNNKTIVQMNILIIQNSKTKNKPNKNTVSKIQNYFSKIWTDTEIVLNFS